MKQVVLQRVVVCLLLLLVPAMQGLAQSEPPSPELYRSSNVTPNVLDLFGVFFHRRARFPEVRQFTDISVVKLGRDLEKSEQEASDFNLFILDGTQGVIVYTIGLIGMGADSFPQFKGAKQLAVLPNGRLAVILADSRVDLCASFTGERIRYPSGCGPLSMKAVRVTAAGTDDVLTLTEAGTLQAVDTISGEQELLELPLMNIREVHSDGETFAFIHDNGRAVATYRNLGGNCIKEWGAWRTCQRSNTRPGQACNEPKQAFQTCKKANPGNHTVRFKLNRTAARDGVPIRYADGTESEPLSLSGLARNQAGFYYVVSEENDAMFLLGPELVTLGVVTDFAQWPRPFRRMFMPRGVRLVPASGLVHVFNSKAMEVISERPETARDVTRRNPPELLPVFEALNAIPMESFLADPGQDIMSRPEIKKKILEAISNLRLK
jgi:hypothetical protein